MTTLLSRFRAAIESGRPLDPTAPELLIESSGNLACHYAPFDHVNHQARVVLLGMTPGTQQARNALASLRSALNAGLPDDEALRRAKETASFSGAMRTNLIKMLDHVGLHRNLGLESCADLFTHRTDLVHFTSALRYPVFLDGKDYSGTPSILATPFLASMCGRWLADEIAQLQDAYWIPLGKEAKAALASMEARGLLRRDRILDGMPHPSGANAERIAYFLGNKPREMLSSRTSADALDVARDMLIRSIGSHVAIAPSQSNAAMHAAPVKLSAQRHTPRRNVSSVQVVASSARRKPVSAKAQQAEALVAARFEPIRAANAKIAGFQTGSGRHLAIQRGAKRIQVWTEAVPAPQGLGAPRRYPANKSRHSNLAAQAPRVAQGRDALLWSFENTDELQRLLAWYARA